jgi:hypothetical protein
LKFVEPGKDKNMTDFVQGMGVFVCIAGLILIALVAFGVTRMTRARTPEDFRQDTTTTTATTTTPGAQRYEDGEVVDPNQPGLGSVPATGLQRDREYDPSVSGTHTGVGPVSRDLDNDLPPADYDPRVMDDDLPPPEADSRLMDDEDMPPPPRV